MIIWCKIIKKNSLLQNIIHLITSQVIPAYVDATQPSELPYVVRGNLLDDVRGEVQHLQIVLHWLEEGHLQRYQFDIYPNPTLQGDPSGSSQPHVYIKTKVAFQYIRYMLLILEHNFCFDVNRRLGTTWWVTLYRDPKTPTSIMEMLL